MADETRHAWAAGFMDGEGSFCLLQAAGNCHSSTKRCMIGASQNNPEPLQILADLYGGRVRKLTPGGKRIFYQWQIANAEMVREAVTRMLPYLVNKKAEAEVILAYAITIKRGQILTPEMIALRAELIDQHKEARAAQSVERVIDYRG